MAEKDPAERTAVECQTCERLTVGVVKASQFWSGYSSSGQQVEPPCTYFLISCEACGDVQLHCRQQLDPEYLDDYFRLWPQTRQLPWSVPEPVRIDWNEATTCFSAGAYAASVVMVRRMLEGICKEKGVSKKTLYQALDQMKDDGHIDENLAKWGHMLREIGNTGAHHTGEKVPRDNAAEALDFAEAFANYVFVLRGKYEAYVSRQGAKTSTP